jgi:hypothetical protein
MSPIKDKFLIAMDHFSREQVRQAGQRYTPGIDPQAPNLRITALFDAIQNLFCGKAAKDRFREVIKQLNEAWSKARYGSQRKDAIDAILAEIDEAAFPILARLRNRDASAAEEWKSLFGRMEESLRKDMEFWRAEEERLSPSGGKANYSDELSKARSNSNAIWQCLTITDDEIEYTESVAFKVLHDPKLLISGEWGTGKTHFLCDITLNQIERNQITILALAKNFEGKVLEEICSQLAPDSNIQEVIDRLEEAAVKLDDRAIIVVDGINEGRRKEWKNAISTLMKAVAEKHNIGVIVSCRSPFEGISIATKDLSQFHKIRHFGFDDQEFDAQAEFFRHYNLSLPEVPLLDKEFSRPLTLKLICQSLQSLTGKKLNQGFSGIASGQKGMTYVLESFINHVGEGIETQFALPRKSCWQLLKGSNNFNDIKLSGIAPCMAANLRGYVRPSEVQEIIAAHFPVLAAAGRKSLLEALRTNGLIEEDVVWYSTKSGNKSRIVYRLPYQRFSDHLIARHLLKTYLDASSPEAIRKSFASRSPLSRPFKLSKRFQYEYAEPSWAQALITEFPTRVGNKLPPKERELFLVLPKNSQHLSAYFEPFIEGLFWRDPAAFSEGTRLIINQYLNAGDQVKNTTIDALVAVSTKPKHPYHARRLYEFLARQSMPERDLMWSEYLRRKYYSPTIQRLLAWCGHLNAVEMTEPSAKELIVLLSLVLTTVDRSDRDLATKALVMIGERFPEALFSHAITSLDFNDPYVPERMLAAAYGVTMSLVDSELASEFRPMLDTFASAFYEAMFVPGGRHATHHALMRDYALGIIELARKASGTKISGLDIANISKPFSKIPSKFIGDGIPDQTIKKAIDHAIHMDFGNYTIGNMIPDRGNYNNDHPEYVTVRSKIERRIFDLGYRGDLFKSIDDVIGRTNFRQHDANKVDRYGKKYSWIAYFEMYGEREALNLLPEWRQGERTPNCDIDPSFPKPPPAWGPPIPDLFGDLRGNAETWVAGGYTPDWSALNIVQEIGGAIGEWVLIDGFIRGVNKDHDREIFAFLRGFFVDRSDITKLERQFISVDHPGSNFIPDRYEEHYLFSGEAGKRERYASYLLQKNGKYRRQVKSAFSRTVMLNDEYVHIPGVRVEIPSVSYGWESYHSTQNQFSGFFLPSPSIIQRLNLSSKKREIDFYDSAGRPATLYRESGGWYGENHHSLLYIRADLLRQYLTKTRQALVWLNWGEREWFKKMDGHNVINNPARQRVWQKHQHIHRSFLQWDSKK